MHAFCIYYLVFIQTYSEKSVILVCAQVSCGINHTLALSSDGMTLWAFGDGDYGKLGTGPCTVKCYPQVLLII